MERVDRREFNSGWLGLGVLLGCFVRDCVEGVVKADACEAAFECLVPADEEPSFVSSVTLSNWLSFCCVEEVASSSTMTHSVSVLACLGDDWRGDFDFEDLAKEDILAAEFATH